MRFPELFFGVYIVGRNGVDIKTIMFNINKMFSRFQGIYITTHIGIGGMLHHIREVRFVKAVERTWEDVACVLIDTSMGFKTPGP